LRFEASASALGGVLAPEDYLEYTQGMAAAGSQLDEEAFEKAWAEGGAIEH
jgi:hypothetical protein